MSNLAERITPKNLLMFCSLVVPLLLLIPFWKTVILSAIFAIVLYPVSQKLAQYISFWAANLTIVCLLFIGILLPMILVTISAVQEGMSLSKQPQIVHDQILSLQQMIQQIPYVGVRLVEWVKGLDIHDVERYLKQSVSSIPAVLDWTKNIAAHLTIRIFLFMLFLYQFLMIGEHFKKQFAHFFDLGRDHFFLENAIKSTRAISLSMVIASLVSGVLMTIVYFVMGLSVPILLGFITALCALVPFFLPIFYFLMALVLLATQGFICAIVVVGIGLAINQFTDHILQPKIIGKHMQLGFVVSLLSIITGLSTLGLIGVFIGPISFHLALSWLEEQK